MTNGQDTPGPPGGRTSTERLKAAADAAGLTVEIVLMPESTRTAEEAAQACGCAVGQIVKSLIFKTAHTGKPVLLLVSGSNRVNERQVADLIGEPLARMSGREVRDVTGFAIGGVAPLGATAPLATYFDRDLLQHEFLWAAGGKPNAVFRTNPDDLLRATGAQVIDMG